ncbi:MAG: HAMP domain-containing protein [Clostridium fessum]
MSFLSSLAFSIALSLFLWSKILCPIGSISLAAKQVADGDFSVHVPNSKSLQAICELTDNFNRMVQELNSIESLRNDFVTTVSHGVQDTARRHRGLCDIAAGSISLRGGPE